MQLSVELSFYPLQDDYKAPIKQVIAKLKSLPSIEVHANRMSTQIFGDFDDVTKALNETMKWSFNQFGQAVFVAKMMNSDRRPK